ncbi:phage tail tip lysozyme [Salipiger marinus]|uniref:phage tail tip lysozyme n=1 Tax=Salipiger marinus TaxID=555512 RepID=UPI002BB03EB0|nr:phage tail tip lysozyme [Salipiger manganoxidans]MEB3417549.1 phage tail tip lysozyme [Salipiger manganoxidans]
MAAKTFSIAAIFRGDVSQLKPATQEARREVTSVGEAAAKSAPLLVRQADALELAAAAARDAATSADSLAVSDQRARDAMTGLASAHAAAVRPLGSAAQGMTGLQSAMAGAVGWGASLEAAMGSVALASAGARDAVTRLDSAHAAARSSLSGFAGAMSQQQTALQGAMSATSGFTATIGDQTSALVQNQRASAAWQAELDGVRAKFNPIFALSRQYEAQLRDIAEAEKLGAISAREAADARERAARVLAPTPVQAPATPPRQVEDLRGRYMPLYAAERRYERELEQVSEARRIGALSDEEAIVVQERLRGSYDQTVEQIRRSDPALRGQGQAMRLNAHEARNLSYQLSDTFQTLALGMPIQQVLLQQGPQIIDIYGGVGNTFRALRAALTPVRLALGATTAAVVVGAAAWNGYLTSVKEVQTAAGGLGRATAAPAAELEAAAQAGASTAGISIKAARSMQAEFLRTGRIGSENFEGLIGISKDFAATIGIEAAAAGGALSEMFAKPAEGADTLYRKYGLIDAATMRQVRNLAEQNRGTEAQTLLLDALQPRLVDAAEATTLLGRAWDDVKTAASDAGNAIGGAINRVFSGPSREEELQDRIAAAQKRLQDLDGGRKYLRLSDDDREQRRAEAQAELAQAELELASTRARASFRQSRAAAEARGRNSLDVAGASPANARLQQEEQLRNEIASLEAGQNAPGLDDFQRGEIGASIEAKSRALDALINRQERTLELDRLDIQIANERNPLFRAELEARRTRLKLAEDEINILDLEAEVHRARSRVIEETIAAGRQQAADMQAEMEIRQRLTGLVSAGLISSAEANRLLEEELALRPLVAAAAAAEGEEKTRLLEVLDQLRGAYAATAEADRTARATEAGQEHLRSQRERLAMLRVEIGLIGQSAAVQARTLALARAEQNIRSMKLDPQSAQAQEIRQTEVALSDLERSLERQRDAWGKVQGSAEAAIDGIVGKLSTGDVSGALESLASEMTGLFTEIAVSNPLKNAILGTDYGTLSDVGGLEGIISRIFGGKDAPGELASAATAGPSVAAMTVSAGSVTITAGTMGFGGAAGQMPGAAANSPGSILTGGSLPGSQEVQSQVWRFFSDKGLAPHQVAAIMGNVSAESAFNPTAVGDGGTSFGLFQHHAGRGEALLNTVGGRGGLGNVEAQLGHVWSELQGSENGVLQRLLAATNVKDATAAFVGFERPQGWTAADPTGAHNWTGRLGGAEQAMTKFASAASTATTDLGALGEGATGIGSLLSSIGSGMAGGGGGGSLLWTVASGIAGAVGIPGFRDGGPTGGSDPSRVAGVVHEEEFVFDAPATRRIGVRNLEALRKGVLRGYQAGGYVQSVASVPVLANSAPAPQQAFGPIPITVNNYSGQEIQSEIQPDGRGGRQMIMTVGQQGAAAIRQPGNPMNKQLKRMGVKSGPVRR